MSHTGKMNRGEMWHNIRDRDGNYPEGILNDPNKMEEINYFLEHSKEPEPEPVKKSKKKEE